MLLESSLLVQAIVVALLVVFASGVRDLIGFTMLDRPIFICPIVGWLFGDIQQGLLIGVSLEAVFMGVVNVGGASSAECGIASVVGTAFAMKIGGGTEVALFLYLINMQNKEKIKRLQSFIMDYGVLNGDYMH